MADTLAGWAVQVHAAIPRQRQMPGGLLFAFYGRMSTEDYQDPVSSRQWQWDNATELIDGHGTIAAEFFDIGYTRRLRWPRRPQAAALLEAIVDPGRGFSAVVLGEYARAFYSNQFTKVAPLFAEHSVQLWMPEVDGPVDFANPDHLALMWRLGMKAKKEVWLSQVRVIAAMQAQARDQGRFLGGRPPYGYRLVDAGPHPNREHAKWGRRLHRLEPDPHTAPTVQWIFARRLAGHSVASIVRDLNTRRLPCPSNADPSRNRHRPGDAWQLRTVAAILANPRYTGRQVWNRQYTDHNPDDPKNQVRRGAKDVMRWNTPDRWVISNEPAHTALISEQDFVAAQKTHAAPTPHDGSTRTYVLAGFLRCGICDRKMDSHWANNRPGYRCRHGHNSSKQPRPDRPKTLYVREDRVLAEVAAGIASDGLHRWADVEAMLRSNQAVITVSFGGAQLTVAAAPGTLPRLGASSHHSSPLLTRP